MIHKPLIGQLTKNFHSSEFMCNDPSETIVPAYYTSNMVYLAVQLQKIRDFLNLDILIINSAYRTKTWNKNVGGADNSNHLTCMAADITSIDISPKNLYQAIKDMIKLNLLPDGELLQYSTFVHYSPTFDWKHLPEQAITLPNESLFNYPKHRFSAIIKTQNFNPKKYVNK